MAKDFYFLRFPGGKGKAITLSYDDGVDQDIRLLKLMEQYGFKGTFNLNSGMIPPEGTTYDPGKLKGRRMPLSQIKHVYDTECAEVAIHTLNHPNLSCLPGSQIMHEVVEDRKNLEQIFGKLIRGMAYPYGDTSDEAVEVLRLAGVAYARTTVATGKFDLPTDWLRMPATSKHTNPHLMELAEKFAAMEIRKQPKLFYLWGHSYEFDVDNNWHVIEAFFERMAGRPDVWYATNIQIYDYVQAYQRLCFSCTGKRVYNPTVTDIWLGTPDGNTVCVSSNTTVELK